MTWNKLTILILVAALLIGPSLLGGVDLLTRHFCAASSGGVCGLLQGIAASLNHLSSIQALFIFFAPVVFAAFLILFKQRSDKSVFYNRGYATTPNRLAFVTSSDERHWITIKTNSPNDTR